MSSPIKPPGGPKSPPTPIGGASPSAKTDSTAKSGNGERFAEVSQAERASNASPANATQAVSEVAAKASVEDAIKVALESPMAQRLTPEGRAGLEATLRARLAEDPTLIALTKEAEAG